MDLTEVILTEGKVIQREVELGIDVFSYKLGDFKISRKSPVSIRVENIGDRKLVLEGSADIEVLIPCARCLEPVATGLHIQFDYKTELDEKDYIDGYNLDVDKLVCSEILVSWPSKVLCKENCKGLCNTCGTNLNLKTCDCEPTDLDPRMAQIQEIFNKFKEV